METAGSLTIAVDRHMHPYYAIAAEEVLRELGVRREQGLSDTDAETRRDKYGANQLREARRRGAWLILLDQFKSIVILIMGAAAVVAFATARWGRPKGWSLPE